MKISLTAGGLMILWTLNLAALPLGWRMDGSGTFPQANPPLEWSTEKNLEWATPVTWSNSSVVLLGDRLFLCAEPNRLLCLSTDGKILWDEASRYEDLLNPAQLAQLEKERAQLAPMIDQETAMEERIDQKEDELDAAKRKFRDNKNDKQLEQQVETAEAELAELQAAFERLQQQMATAFPVAVQWRLPITHGTNGFTPNTPCTDGQRVYTVYVSGLAAAYTLDGQRQWLTFVEKPVHRWGQYASPVLADGVLIVQVINTFGLDPATGEILWKTAPEERFKKNWGSPAVFTLDGQELVLTDAGQVIRPKDGKLLGSDRRMSLAFGSPQVVGDIAYCVSDRAAGAYRFTWKSADEVEIEQLWQTPMTNGRYYATPLIHDGLWYISGPRSVFTVLDIATGEKVYEERLEDLKGITYNSPVLAGDVIIVSSEGGQAYVIKPGRKLEILARNQLPIFRTTPVFAGNRMYLRTTDESSENNWVYCFSSN